MRALLGPKDPKMRDLNGPLLDPKMRDILGPKIDTFKAWKMKKCFKWCIQALFSFLVLEKCTFVDISWVPIWTQNSWDFEANFFFSDAQIILWDLNNFHHIWDTDNYFGPKVTLFNQDLQTINSFLQELYHFCNK